MIQKYKNYLIIGSIVLFTFILYGNTIQNKYSIDDDFVTYNNPTIQKGLKAIPEIFTSLYSARENLKYEYRPVVKVSYAIEYEFFGQNPHISHLINILIYAFTCVLLFFILKKLLTPVKYPDKSGFHGASNYNIFFPLTITALFLAHPIHTEVVCSLKNRDELFSFLGCLAALHFFIKYAERDKITYILIGLFFYLFALLSKLTTLTFVVIFPLILYFFTNTKPKKILYVFLSVFVIALIAKYAPKLYLPAADRQKLFFENPLLFETNIFERLPTGFYSLIFYVKLLFYPHPLLFYYGYDMLPVVGWLNGWVIFSFIFHLSVFIYAIIKIKAKHILAFAILYYLVSISMFANIVKPVMGIVGERFLYASSLGFCIIIAYFIFRLAKLSKAFGIIILIIVLIPYSAKTITRNKDWENFLTLFSNDIKYLENSAKANALMAGILLDEVYKNIPNKEITSNREKIDLTIKHYKQALYIYPEYSVCLNNLGTIYLIFFKQYELAIPYFQKAIDVNPKYVEAYFNLGHSYKMLHKPDEAIKYYRQAVEINPEHIKNLSNLANLYYKNGDFETAVKINEELMKTAPDSHLPYVNIGSYYLLKYDTVTAVLYWEKAVEKFPQNIEISLFLSQYYKQKGDFNKADYFYAKAIETQRKMN